MIAAWLLLGAVAFGVAAPRTDAPGLYYDEAFMAQQARDFLTPNRLPDHATSVRQVWIAGRPFPLRNAVYLGSLKSQLLIPSFALFGASKQVLRLTTLFWSWLGVLFAMALALRFWGTGAALVTGLLLMSDPAWFFFSLHEWGPFTTGFLCRAVGFWCCASGWTLRRPVRLLMGGAALGLGVYNRADFVVILAAAALALLWVRPQLLREAWSDRRRDALLIVAAATLAAAPMLLSVTELVTTTSSGVIQSRGGVDEKLRVLWSVLDGSRYFRIIDTGGQFEAMFDAAAPASGLGLAVLLAGALAWWRGLARRTDAPGAAAAFVLVAGLLTIAGMLAVPGAVRAHHQLNLWPFAHWWVAAVAAGLWTGASGHAARAIRVALCAAVAAVVVANTLVIARTYALIEETGGRGRFSDSLDRWAKDIERQPGTRVTSFDWGLHESVLFQTTDTSVKQPIWRLPQAATRLGAWVHTGDDADVYLAHEEDYDLMGFGLRFLAAARASAAENPQSVRIAQHRDREGSVVFVSVRFLGPHRVRYAKGRFQIEGLGREGL